MIRFTPASGCRRIGSSALNPWALMTQSNGRPRLPMCRFNPRRFFQNSTGSGSWTSVSCRSCRKYSGTPQTDKTSRLPISSNTNTRVAITIP